MYACGVYLTDCTASTASVPSGLATGSAPFPHSRVSIITKEHRPGPSGAAITDYCTPRCAVLCSELSWSESDGVVVLLSVGYGDHRTVPFYVCC